MIGGGQRTRIRLEDVALAAGVSKSIASRILNDRPALSVREDTRERVQEAARRLNYRPHAGARGLRRAETGAIGLSIPDLAMGVYARIVRGAFHRALERDFAVLLVEDLVPEESEAVFARLVVGGRIDGVIVASARPGHPLLGSLGRYEVPHVFVNRAVAGTNRSVVMDDARGSEAALRHLVELGHWRIGHVAGPSELDPARRRAESFAAHAASLGLADAPIEVGDFSERGGAGAAVRLLERSPSLTALYVSTLAQAVGVLDGAWRLGLRVPEDLSLVTYDDMPLADYLRPPVTTVRMPLSELGAAAVDALIAQLLGSEPSDIVIETHPTVVARSSTAPPPVRS